MSYIAIFMAKRILDAKETYEDVVAARADLKEGIDQYLKEYKPD